VLKSPPYTARIAVLSKPFPKARFVRIVRDPVEVFASSVGLWRSTRRAFALISRKEAAVEQEVLDVLLEMYRDFAAATAALPRGQFHQLRYEDLIRKPLTALEACYQRIGLGDFATVRSRIEASLAMSTWSPRKAGLWFVRCGEHCSNIGAARSTDRPLAQHVAAGRPCTRWVRQLGDLTP